MESDGVTAEHPQSAGSTVRRVRVALAVGLLLLLVALAVVLSQSPLTVAGANSVPVIRRILIVPPGGTACTPAGTLPAGTSAIRLSMFGNAGPHVQLTARSGPEVVASGERAAGWGITESLTVPVNRVGEERPNTEVCVKLGPGIEPVAFNGALGRNATNPEVRGFRVEYLQPGSKSWWSRASGVAERIGRGHAPSGTWIVFLLIALMIAVAALAAQLVIRELRLAEAQNTLRRVPETLGQIPRLLRQIPRAAWTCALVALINAVCWSLITPPFQVPDEPDHFAYVQHLAETASLPIARTEFSQEEATALRDLSQSEVRAHPETHPVATSAEGQRLQRDLARPLRRSGSAGAGDAAGQPPLYYALQTIPYGLGSSGSLLDRLELMRLLSAVMAALTALFAYLFVREALPRFRWAWAVGGLGVALWPLLGFMSGAVNPDAMLFAVSAAIFYLLARGFRRGLTPGLAAAIGAATAIGVVTKLNFVGLTPGIALGLVVLALRAARTSKRSAYRSLALGVGIAASPVLAYLVINLFSNHAGLGASVSGVVGGTEGSVFNEISYIWQYYLPRLPGMAEEFPGIFTPGLWFERSVGQYGWLDTTFPTWVYDVALIPAALLAILGIRALVRSRASLRSRAGDLCVYALMAAGLLGLVAATSYAPSSTLPHFPAAFWQARYVLPLIPLLGAALVLSARGAGRRWGPVAGALIVVLILAHDVFSQLQVISRFYG
jgi:hypothetical protein